MNYNKAEFLFSCGLSSQLPQSDEIEIAFAGRSNVGKSSLINKLVNRKSLARTSSTPGKTATINFFKVDNIRFVDLPGYGYAKVSKSEKERWSELIEGYFAQDRNLSLVIQLIDIRHSPSLKDIDMINYLIDAEIPFIIVFTKSDKLKNTEKLKRLKGFENEIPFYSDIHCIEVSSQTGYGIDKLKEVISNIALQ